MAFYRQGSELRNRMSCRVCHEQFDNKIHVPKMLPCQHTFCQICLSSIAAGSNTLTCPLCKSKHSVPNNGFTMNRAVMDIIEEIQKDCKISQTELLKCNEHDKVCVMVCIDCFVALCVTCFKQHKDHHVEDADEATNGLIERLKDVIKQQIAVLEGEKSKINLYRAQIERNEQKITQTADKITMQINTWKKKELNDVASFKHEAGTRAKKIDEVLVQLRHLEPKPGNDIRSIMSNNEKVHNSNENIHKICKQQRMGDYDFDDRHRSLLNKIKFG